MLSQNQQDTQDKTSDFLDLKKKRDEYNIEIRKQKRDDILLKKRNRILGLDPETQKFTAYNLVQDPELRASVDKWLMQTFELTDLYKIVEALNDNDRYQYHYGVIGIRKLLSIGKEGYIQHVIDANVVPRLLHLIQRDDEQHVQLEGVWALANIASGSSHQTKSIVDKGGIPIFVKILNVQRDEILEQAIWAIGNIAGDTATFRDLLLKWGAVDPLIQIINQSKNQAIIKVGSWTLSNLCRGRPLPKLEFVDVTIPTFSLLAQTQTDDEILVDALWALVYLTREKSRVQILLETGIVPRLLSLLGNPLLILVVPCMKILGNIIAGTEEQTNAVLYHEDFLPKLFQLLQHSKASARKEACWILSNITAGSPDHVELILGNEYFMETLLRMATSEDIKVKTDIIWVLSNATIQSSVQQIERMVHNGVLKQFASALSNKDPKDVEILQIALAGINNILKSGQMLAGHTGTGENPFVVELDNLGATAIIEDLQSHPNNDVYLAALKILESFFVIENPL